MYDRKEFLYSPILFLLETFSNIPHDPFSLVCTTLKYIINILLKKALLQIKHFIFLKKINTPDIKTDLGVVLNF